MPMLPIYIFGALANALVSSINSRKQQALQERLAQEGRDSQAESQKRQQEFQISLHERGYKEQIASQLRAFKLTNSWPLKIEPSQVAKMLTGTGNVPLLLIIAPAQQSGIQKELYSMWDELHNFFMTTFPLNSTTPVVHCGYREGFPVSRQQDVATIFTELKEIPTLYIAPYSTERDNVLGVTVAFWGLGGSSHPTTANFELDVRRLYIDEIRAEAKDYKARCDDGRLVWDDKAVPAMNWRVFEKEEELIRNGNDFYYLDQMLNHYQGIRPSKATYNLIADKILPVIKLLSASIVDVHFVLEYGTKPLFPAVARELIDNNQFPDLLARGLADRSDKFTVTKGTDFVMGMCGAYARFIAKNVTVDYFENHKEVLSVLGADCSQTMVEIVGGRKKELEWRNESRNHISGGRSGNLMDETKVINAANEAIKEKCYVKAFNLLSSLPTNVEAQTTLGEMYLKGVGCSQNRSKGLVCLDFGARNGSDRACRLLYFALKDTDARRAVNYLVQAAEHNDIDALFILASLRLTKGDVSSAEKLFIRGADLGDSRAVAQLKKLKLS